MQFDLVHHVYSCSNHSQLRKGDLWIAGVDGTGVGATSHSPGLDLESSPRVPRI